MPISPSDRRGFDIANGVEADRIAFVGDKRQLGAIEAGKPFETTQARLT